MVVTAEYADEDEYRAYLAEYGKALEELGFHDESSDDEGRYENASGDRIFRYLYDDQGNLALVFTKYKNYTPAEAAQMISDAGIPVPAFTDDILCRDISRYSYYTRGFDGAIYLSVSQPFGSAGEAEEYLNDYVSVLEENGYERENPENVGSLKQNCYYNEEEEKYVAFDYFPSDDSALINLDFVSFR